jgi:hypothetical protein
MNQVPGLSREEWTKKLTEIGQKTSGQLCLIGSAACMFSGMDGRTSIDLDVWRPASRFDEQEFQNAVEESGLLYNPTGEITDKPYIQVVEPGICQTGDFAETQTMMQTGQLEVSRPPLENLIASKLLRCEPRDLEDISHLMTKFQPDTEKVRDAIESMPRQQREKALENLVYLEVLSPDNGI